MAILGSTKVTDLTLLDGVIGNLNPVNTGVYDLGTSSLKWRMLYGNVTGDLTGNASSATKLKNGRTFQIKDADNTNAGNASSAFTGESNLIINLPSTIKATLSGNAATATKLKTAKTIQTNLASISSASFDGSDNITPGVTGILGIANGGTGASTDADARTNLGLGTMATETATDYLKLSGGTMTGTLYTKSVAKDNFIITPDKYFATTYSTVGAIKIKLPVSWSSTSMSMKVDIYNYSDDNAITYTIGGYNGVTSGGRWKYCSASCYGFGDKSNLKVRFGHDGSKCCIIIGETDTSWSSPKIIIRDVLLDFDATTVTIANWATGWDIEWITSLPSKIDVEKENTNITYNFPKKDGTGATGSWGIDITGNAATATAANLTTTTENAIAKYSNTTGAFANSGVLIDGSNNLYPNTTNSSLGSTTKSWKNIYITQGGGANTSQGLQYVNTSGTLLSKIMVNSSNNLIIQVPEDKQIVARNSLTASDKGLILTRDQLEFYNVSTLKMSDGDANTKSVSLIFNTTTNALNFVFA